MATPLRIALLMLAMLIAALIGVAIFLLNLDPEDWREDIDRGAEDATGLDLRLDGPMSFSLFPTLALTVADVRADWVDAGSTPLLQVRAAELAIPLLPLLTGAGLQIENVRLDGVRLDLRVAADGRDNWTPPQATDEPDKQSAADPAPTDTAPADGAPPEIAIDVQIIEIADLEVRYADARDDSEVALTGLDVRIDGRREDLLDLTLGGRLRVKDGADVDFSGALRADTELRQITISELRADIDLPDWPERLPVRLEGSLRRDSTRLLLEDISASAGELRLTVAGTVATDESEAVALDVALGPTNLRALLDRADAAPDTLDPEALSALSGTFAISGTRRAVALDAIEITLDAITLTGTGRLRAAPTPFLGFDLSVGAVDLTPYASTSSSAETAASGPLVDETPLGLEAIGDYEIDGRLQVAALTAGALETSALSLRLDGRDGRLHAELSIAELLGGDVAADVDVDVRAATPKVALTLDAQGLDGGTLLPGAGITGPITLAGRMEAIGDSTAALARGADGRLALSGSAGTFDVRPLRSGLLPLAQLLGEGERLAAWPDTIGYEALTGAWTLVDGTGNQRLELAMDNLRLDGAGGIDLADGTFDFAAGALFAAAPPRTFDVPRDLDGIRLPARCLGTLDDAGNPCGFDASATGDLVRQIASSRAGDKIREQLQNRVPEQLRGPADALLQGLFGRPKPQTPPQPEAAPQP